MLKRKESKIYNRILNSLNGFNLQKKFFILYFFCVLIPLFITDFIIIRSAFLREEISLHSDMDYVASLYQNEFSNLIETDLRLASSINMNDRINELLSKEYSTAYEYYNEYYEVINGSFLQTLVGLTSDSVCVYTDNDTILDSMFFKKLSGIKDEEWYNEFAADGRRTRFFAYYKEDLVGSYLNRTRRIFFVMKMNPDANGKDRIIVIENDGNELVRQLKKIGSKYNVYITIGNDLMFSNQGDDIYSVKELPANSFTPSIYDFEYRGSAGEIYISPRYSLLKTMLKDNGLILMLLLIFTIFIPYFAMKIIERNIVERILKLENAFQENSGKAQDDTFVSIEKIEGSDEISGLMRKYNEMVMFINELVNTVYKDRLKKQENDIARKNAELLALQSQINPHFLFNALESIRMHSLLRGEEETALMVGRLAVMQRQNVEWGQDLVTIKKEMESIEAYLTLQGYRFGERLSFEIDMDDDCADYLVPKLTIVTFVENACVHGIEMKASPGWIFVRTYKKDGFVIIEVEDTGGGMAEADLNGMIENINNVSIDAIKGKKHVGILNACLRLKMVSDNLVSINIDSEEGVGMSVEIKVPIDVVEKLSEREAE